MASVRVYLVVLVVVAVVFAVLWLMAYANYAGLETMYAKLQSRYNTLESNYTSLKTNYNNLQSQYQTLQSQYSGLQINYTILKGQYEQLQNLYRELSNSTYWEELNNTYWELFTFLGQDEWYSIWGGYLHITSVLPRELITAPANSTTASMPFSAWLEPDQYIGIWVVVPSNFSAIINITANATGSPVPVDVYVFNLSNYVQWLKGYSPTYYFYTQGKLINDTVTVPGPGIYIVVFYNPSNTTTVKLHWLTSLVTATFIQSSS
jgi:predicted component of type VI protein secretion system